MEHQRNNEMGDNRRIAFASTLALIGTLATAGCLQLNEEHCVSIGGSAACGGMMCSMTEKGEPPESSRNGCVSSLDGLIEVKYGLPKSFGEQTDRGWNTVWGTLNERGCDVDATVLAQSGVEEAFVALHTELQDLDGRTRVLKRKIHIDGAVVGVFDEAMESVCPDDPSVTGTDTDTSTGTNTNETVDSTATSETSESSTTGPMLCSSSEECTEPEPFCGTMGYCVATCDLTANPDGECEAVDEMMPLCVRTECVACTLTSPAVCDAMLLVCSGATNTCVPCTEHEQCASGACELAVGTCFSPNVVVPFNGSVVDTVNSIGDGMHGVIVVPELDAGGDYQGNVLVDGGKVIALVAAPDEQPIMRGMSSNPSVSVVGPATVLYVNGLRIAGNTSGLGLSVDDAVVWVDRSHIVQNAAGGILATNGAELTVRNSFVGDGTNGEHALTVDGSSARVLSTTLGVGFDNFANVFPVFCTGTTDVTIRNSLLVSFDGPSELSCPGAMVTTTASEALIPGTGNVGLGNIAADWFMGVDMGDFHLDNPPMELGTTAVWLEGDPTTDIDGALRPTVDLTPDYAGADIP